MKIFVFISALIFAGISYGQTEITIFPVPTDTVIIQLTPFGSDNPVNIGSFDTSGKGLINESSDLSYIPESLIAESKMPIFSLLGFCDNSMELFPENDSIFAIKMGLISLMKNNGDVGYIKLVSDMAIVKWIEDQGSEKAVVGSWFELIYMTADYSYKGVCTESVHLGYGNYVETAFELDLDLKAGFNYIEYKIESVYQDASERVASYPKQVNVTTHQTAPSNAKWIAHYY